jgi:heat shock protein HslJ
MKGTRNLLVIIVAVVVISLVSGCASGADATPRGNMISLPGTTWVLLQLDGENLAGNITMIFDEEQVSGNASCNNYFGQYTLDDSKFTLGPIGSTMMACPEMDNETLYLTALSEVVTLRFEEEQLILVDESGQDRLVYAQMQHASLEDTTWVLTGWNTGNAITSVIIGTEISLEIKEDGVNGSAGCNTYFSSAAFDETNLEFGVIANTEMACMDPEGVMEQETGYLKVLSQVKSYEIFGDMLTMFDEGGTRLLTFIDQTKIR